MTGSIQVGNENKSILITHTNKENKISLSSKKLRSWFLKFSRTSSTPYLLFNRKPPLFVLLHAVSYTTQPQNRL